MKSRYSNGCPIPLERLSDYAHGALSGPPAAEAARHLESCEDCRRVFEDLQSAVEIATAALSDPSLSERLPAALLPEQKRALARVAQRRRERIAFRRRALWPLAAAAVLVAGFIGGWRLTRGGAGRSSVIAVTTPPPAELAAMEAEDAALPPADVLLAADLDRAREAPEIAAPSRQSSARAREAARDESRRLAGVAVWGKDADGAEQTDEIRAMAAAGAKDRAKEAPLIVGGNSREEWRRRIAETLPQPGAAPPLSSSPPPPPLVMKAPPAGEREEGAPLPPAIAAPTPAALALARRASAMPDRAEDRETSARTRARLERIAARGFTIAEDDPGAIVGRLNEIAAAAPEGRGLRIELSESAARFKAPGARAEVAAARTFSAKAPAQIPAETPPPERDMTLWEAVQRAAVRFGLYIRLEEDRVVLHADSPLSLPAASPAEVELKP